jgi:RNA polymerase sigma-70 factor (ECF subfamily)
VRAAQQGDVAAFESLVREHQGAVYAFAVAQLGDPHEARDAAQEALVKAFRRLDTYRFAAPFRTWLLQITRNGCHDRQRRQRSRREGLQRLRAQGAPADPPLSPERELQARETTARVHEALARIDPLYREVIVLFDLQGRSYPEIAEICSIPLGTVKSRLGRGREALRRIFGEEEEKSR